MTREVIHAASFEGQVEQEFSIGKVLLVSDWAQLQAVDAGGAFTLLVADWYDAPELVDVHRFVHAWEKTASLDLRHGRIEATDTYPARPGARRRSR